jgi:hypothetical protein
MPGTVPIPTPIIHMTHVNNLAAIIQSGGPRSNAVLERAGVQVTSIAYTSIQAQRATKIVPCGPGGCLHDYVPFYFGKKSPMLFTISRGNVACDGGQDSLVHLVSTAQAVEAAGLGFTFTDGHGIMSYSDFYDDLGQLGEVDWDIMAARYWHDTATDGDRKRRRQAEFLVRDQFPWELVTDIVVRTESVRGVVSGMIGRLAHRPRVTVDQNWYY